ncbi:MAG: hypothetical protein ERJ68_05040 [Aphanocapsa feldmannii 277cI]|uniref:Lon proteolytic domain-containing protein n=1 Tax=Aphanocapsa feldmannii 277cI TaxID=2507554 RepID=A0A524RUJ0_9CHRO|nr:MAG: hypothetical protein ERJ68_05040 [Aphanocapsa feldmannii 277cI]
MAAPVTLLDALVEKLRGCNVSSDVEVDPLAILWTDPPSMDTDRSGAGLGLPIMASLVGGLLDCNTRASTIIVGSLNLGGSVEMIPNGIAVAELAVEKQAKVLLMPVSARRGLNDLPDDLWTKTSIDFLQRS